MPEPMDHLPRDRWSDEHAALPEHAYRALAARWGRGGGRGGWAPTPGAVPAAPPLPPSTLGEPALAAFAAAVGGEHVRTDEESRRDHATGMSYLDLLARRLGGGHAAPDAVVLPAGPGEVQAVLAACREHDVAVVPFGGGTSVVGGVAPLRGGKPAVVALDLRRLDRLTHVDPVSRLATLGAGVTGPAAERLLAEHGLTLGHVPQSFERATLGGFAATRSAGQASSGFGRFEDMVQGLRLATPAGEWRLGRAPASAAGPDLVRLVLGSEGAFGVITEVTVRTRPLPAHRRYEGVVLDGWQRGVDAVRALAQRGVLADVTRLSDPTETDLGLALSGGAKTAAVRRYLRLRGVGDPCLLILGWEDTDRRHLRARRRATRRTLRPFRPVSLGTAAGRAWRHGRFAGPRQRDELMARGVCVETLETAAHWSSLPALASAVGAALASALAGEHAEPIVGCHVSHAYETGASLYFTVLVPRDGLDPRGQWQRAKRAAMDAVARHHGTVTHHHAVGTEHLPWLAGEIGALGVEVLGAVKATLDPTGVLNPGKLVEPGPLRAPAARA